MCPKYFETYYLSGPILLFLDGNILISTFFSTIAIDRKSITTNFVKFLQNWYRGTPLFFYLQAQSVGTLLSPDQYRKDFRFSSDSVCDLL